MFLLSPNRVEGLSSCWSLFFRHWERNLAADSPRSAVTVIVVSSNRTCRKENVSYWLLTAATQPGVHFGLNTLCNLSCDKSESLRRKTSSARQQHDILFQQMGTQPDLVIYAYYGTIYDFYWYQPCETDLYKSI